MRENTVLRASDLALIVLSAVIMDHEPATLDAGGWRGKEGRRGGVLHLLATPTSLSRRGLRRFSKLSNF